MSCTKAWEQLQLADFQKTMGGVYIISVHASTLDEAPMAYKTMKSIVESNHPTVEINSVIRPVYNFKA